MQNGVVDGDGSVVIDYTAPVAPPPVVPPPTCPWAPGEHEGHEDWKPEAHDQGWGDETGHEGWGTETEHPEACPR